MICSSLTSEEANMGAGVVVKLDDQQQGEEDHGVETAEGHHAGKGHLALVLALAGIFSTLLLGQEGLGPGGRNFSKINWS